MFRTGLPWRWFWDERLVDAADQLHGPLIIPDAHCLTQQQIDVIHQLARNGQGVLWIGNRPSEPWSGLGMCPLPSEFHLRAAELKLQGQHDILAGLAAPVMLASRVSDDGPAGTVLGTVEGRPGLVIKQDNGNRQAWLTGLPAHSYVPPDVHGATRMPSGGVALLGALLEWLAPAKPLIKNGPVLTDYGRLRLWDVRDVPTMEMFPLVSEDRLLAILFPYAPCGYQTTLTLEIPAGRRVTSVHDLWQDQDLTGQLRTDSKGQARLPVKVPGTCEMMVIHFEFG
jgi:hypothetical protein